MDEIEASLEWFRFASDDLEIAKYICNRRPKPFEIICYHCQQSAEKDLKGYLILKKILPPKIHDLKILNKLCCEIDIEFENLDKECRILTPYGIASKYPFELFINERDVASSIANAERIKSFIQAIIK